MSFKDKYTTADLSTKDQSEKDKVILSNDAYVVAELLEKLLIRMERF
jgi:hypothetical protein